MSEMLRYFQSQRDAAVELLTTLIHFETPTHDKAAVDTMGNFMEQKFIELGGTTTRIPLTQSGDAILAKWNADAPGKPIMFLIHIDTVWPVGTLAERPVTIDADGRLFGPGAIDMKGGITLVLETIRGLNETGTMPNRPIWVLMTTDEETGSPECKPHIIEIAKQTGLVLVMEPATIDEALKTQRKGVATFRIDIEGLPSHAGNAPEKGINSIIEFAQQALQINSFNDLKRGVSVSVTVVNGGSATNVIPAHTTGFVDTRTITIQDFDEIREKMMSLEPFMPGAKLTVTQTNGHTPMERNEQMISDYRKVQQVGAKYGVPVYEDSSGGGSDGNTVSALGIPVLDGLGPQGDGLHALHEHVVINSLARRATLLAGILIEWEF